MGLLKPLLAPLLPMVPPALDLDLTAEFVDPRVTFTRASTRTYFDSAGVMRTAAVNEWPREYDPATGACIGRTFWEQKTNLLLRSQEFDNANWTKDAGSIAANAATAPDGTLTADKFIPDSSNSGSHRIRQLTANTTSAHALSFYAKADGYNWIKIRLASQFVNFNVATGVIGQASGGTGAIQSVGNGWYRCTANLVPGSANGFAYIYASTTNDANSDTTAFAGDGTSGILIWGAQLEAASFASPYIPTTTAAVTRSADTTPPVSTLSSIGWNPNEGTLLIEANIFGRPTGGTNDLFTIRDSQASPTKLIAYNNSSDVLAISIFDGNNQAVANGPSLVQNFGRRVVGFSSAGIFACGPNGIIAKSPYNGSYASATVFQLSQLGRWSGGVRRIRYWPLRFADPELRALTA